MFTLNQLIALLRQIANDHYQIKDFGFGSITEFVNREDKLTPCMWVEVTPGQITGNELRLNFDIFFFDLLYSDNSNLQEVLSDMLLIGTDVMAQLTNHELRDYISVNKSASLIPFTARSADIGAGWQLTLSVTIAYEYDRCSPPSDFIFEPPQPGGPCDPVLVRNSDSSYSELVNAGDTLILPDIDFNIYVNGALDQSFTVPSLVDNEINITV